MDITLKPFNARTTVHEYGGDAYLPVEDRVLFSNFDDQKLYNWKSQAATPVRPLTRDNLRYANSCADVARQRIIAVREDHTKEGEEATNTIVALSIDGADKGEEILVSGIIPKLIGHKLLLHYCI